MEKAQALGLKFCSENFPGHPAIVCTHPDGHNHSGNIHVHIVIGSIRTREVERKPFMQKPRDWREGMKHSSTAQTMRHLRVEVMELCEGAGLYQIDLLNGSKERVSEAEYWARRRGQLKLDRENAALTAAGQQPRQKKFETVKDTLRKQISSVLYCAVSLEDFSDRLMQQYGILIDCTPSLGMLTVNALAAADSALIPVQAQYLSAKGLEQLLQTVQKVRRQINPKLKIEGILLTMTDSRTIYGQQISNLIRQAYGKHLKVFDQTIPRSVRAAETSTTGKSIFQYDPKGKVAEAYHSIAKGVLADAEKRLKRQFEQLR